MRSLPLRVDSLKLVYKQDTFQVWEDAMKTVKPGHRKERAKDMELGGKY